MFYVHSPSSIVIHFLQLHLSGKKWPATIIIYSLLTAKWIIQAANSLVQNGFAIRIK